MNNEQRKRLNKIAEAIEEAISDFGSQIQEIADEEQEKYDNMPENLQGSERGEAFDETVMLLEDIVGELSQCAESIQSQIDNAVRP